MAAPRASQVISMSASGLEIQEVTGLRDLQEGVAAHIGRQALKDGGDGGNGGFVAGEQHPLGQARTPFDAAVRFGGLALRGRLLGPMMVSGIAGSGGLRPVGGRPAVAIGVEVHHEVHVDFRVDRIQGRSREPCRCASNRGGRGPSRAMPGTSRRAFISKAGSGICWPEPSSEGIISLIRRSCVSPGNAEVAQ